MTDEYYEMLAKHLQKMDDTRTERAIQYRKEEKALERKYGFGEKWDK